MKIVTKVCAVATLAMLALMFSTSGALAQRGMSGRIAEARMKLEQNPNSATHRQALMRLYVDEGTQLAQAGNYAGSLEAFQNATAVADEAGSMLPESDPVVSAARYGEAYALLQTGELGLGIAALEAIVANNPANQDARLLLGVTLCRNGNVSKGLEVLAVAHDEAEGDDAIRAAQAGVRFGYNHSTIDAALGDEMAALKLLADTRMAFGPDSGATEAENDAMQYAMGLYEMAAGDLKIAVAELEFLIDVRPDYTLNNGVQAKDVLAGAHYRAGVALLTEKNKKNAETALEHFNAAERLDGKDTVDVHHGKALAYGILEDTANVQKELQIIGRLNPARLPQLTQ